MRAASTLAESVANNAVQRKTCFSRAGINTESYVFSRQEGGQLYGFQLDTIAGARAEQTGELALNPRMKIVVEHEHTMRSRHPGRFKTIMQQL